MVDNRKNSSRQVLAEARLAREQRVDTQHAPFAEHTLRVPAEHWKALTLAFPGLNSKDHVEYEAAMTALHASPLADPYRVRTRRAQLGHL